MAIRIIITTHDLYICDEFSSSIIILLILKIRLINPLNKNLSKGFDTLLKQKKKNYMSYRNVQNIFSPICFFCLLKTDLKPYNSLINYN